ncbi:MAG: tRNA glutamyl-Q(34) synthetase GluQRS [Betaproteobacteria bacterium]|nr:tRNA glutamyl-Q(34) synthetase GluQRS [Betaproteobacteria bacterium]
MPYIGRFAPSPTGPLHAGSMIAAIASHLDAKAHGGCWRLRIEDIDETRCQPHHVPLIVQTLAAFGMVADGEVETQSLQKPRYEAALAELTAAGMTYACTCSRREIADSAWAGIEGPVYAGTCRTSHHPVAGNAIRVITHDQAIEFVDRVQGRCQQRIAREVGDFVIRRRDQLFAYQLAVVVDDAHQGITHVVRGADLLDSTARQIHLQRLLGVATPHYLHVPVATNAAGQKLSKQTLAPAVTADEARQVILRTLAFLGQATEAAAEAGTPAEMLAAAARGWEVGCIPAVRSVVW